MHLSLRSQELRPSFAREIVKMPKSLGIISSFILSLTPDARAEPSGFRFPKISDDGPTATSVQATPDQLTRRWASQVSQAAHAWATLHKSAIVIGPRRFVHPPSNPNEPFYPHNHQASVTWIDNGGAWTEKFTVTPNHAEHAGYLSFKQTPDGITHNLSRALHDRSNRSWLTIPAQTP